MMNSKNPKKPNLSLKYWKKSLESNATREEVSKLEERLMKKMK